MRLDKYLSDAGVCSRRQAAALARAGRVLADGQPVRDAAWQVTGDVCVTVDGVPVVRQDALHWMMNKPAGVLTAARDPNAPTVADLLPPLALKRGASPVGRLDKDVTGLLIFTTDGELNHRLTSPKRGVDKVYLAQVDGVLTQADEAAFAAGLELSDFTAKPAYLERLGPSLARVTVHEGKFHQVKRMFLAVGKPVTALKRLSMGGVTLDEALTPGQVRPLTTREVAALRQAAGMEEK